MRGLVDVEGEMEGWHLQAGLGYLVMCGRSISPLRDDVTVVYDLDEAAESDGDARELTMCFDCSGKANPWAVVGS